MKSSMKRREFIAVGVVGAIGFSLPISSKTDDGWISFNVTRGTKKRNNKVFGYKTKYILEGTDTNKRCSIQLLEGANDKKLLKILKCIDKPNHNHVVPGYSEHINTSQTPNTGTYISINYDLCIDCGVCEAVCPEGAIHMEKNKIPNLTDSMCNGCFSCLKYCPSDAISKK